MKKKAKKTTGKASNISIRDRKKQPKESTKKGFTAMRKAKEENRDFSNWRGFFVTKGETRPIIFLTDDLITRRVHTIQSTTPNGKMFYPEALCTEDDDCIFCERIAQGDKNIRRANVTGALLVIDVEGYTTDDKEVTCVVRPLSVNTTLSSVLEHRDLKEGLLYTMFDVSKLERGHSVDVIRDDDDEIQRFKNEKDLIKWVSKENKDTGELLNKALEEHGTFRDWLKDEIVPEWWNPENIKLPEDIRSRDDEDEDDDEEESSRYNFRASRSKSKGSSKTKTTKSKSSARRRYK